MPPEQPTESSSGHIGKTMLYGGWIVGLGLLTLIFSGVIDRQLNPNQRPESRLGNDGVREVVLQRNRYGHYVANGQINGREVEFLLDTGATDVSIPAKMATRLGLKRGQPIVYDTANGNITAYQTRIGELGLGRIRLHDVQASLNPKDDNDTILLGMSFLKHLEFTQRGDTLIIRQYP